MITLIERSDASKEVLGWERIIAPVPLNRSRSVSQKYADGPASSSGHRFGYNAATAAGVPMGWLLRQLSPEQLEHRAKNAEFDAWADALMVRFPSLAGFRQDEWGRRNPGRWLAGNHRFCAAVAREQAIAMTQDAAAREKDRRRAALEAARATGYFRP